MTEIESYTQAQGDGKDAFVHISAVERAGLSTLNEGQHRAALLRKMGELMVDQIKHEVTFSSE